MLVAEAAAAASSVRCPTHPTLLSPLSMVRKQTGRVQAPQEPRALPLVRPSQQVSEPQSCVPCP